MNVIISNAKKEVLEGLSIDIIKSVNGVFEVDELINMFKNFYYQRMILDVTAIKNYADVKTLQKLSISLDMEKVILVLDDSETSSSTKYLSKLISMGIYNFTRNAEGVLYLYNNPNSYRDVAQYHQIEEKNVETEVVYQGVEASYCRIIGIKNLTEQSGATTFVYLMAKQLSKNYKVFGVEVDNTQFNYFNSKVLVSLSSKELPTFIEKHNDCNAIIIDVDKNPTAISVCQEIIYLVEPSVIKLNKLLNFNRGAFKDIAGKKIILNQSLLSSKDALELAYEAKTKFFFNMPPLNERDSDIPIMDTFLAKLGFMKQQDGTGEKKKKILGLF
ncbi:MAG: hypothetical protein E7170_03250 [Firmicutes bacterium]|nr:hypothetical protein [Bacillota bacterium]